MIPRSTAILHFFKSKKSVDYISINHGVNVWSREMIDDFMITYHIIFNSETLSPVFSTCSGDVVMVNLADEFHILDHDEFTVAALDIKVDDMIKVLGSSVIKASFLGEKAFDCNIEIDGNGYTNFEDYVYSHVQEPRTEPQFPISCNDTPVKYDSAALSLAVNRFAESKLGVRIQLK